MYAIETGILVGDLFECAPDQISDPILQWHVLRTKSRQEKILASELDAMGIGSYLPLIRQVRFYAGRKATVEVPIFPGYVFLRGSIDDAYQADRTKRIAQIIRVHDQQQLHWELRNIHLA